MHWHCMFLKCDLLIDHDRQIRTYTDLHWQSVIMNYIFTAVTFPKTITYRSIAMYGIHLNLM